jgi:hypothetical protein
MSSFTFSYRRQTAAAITWAMLWRIVSMSNVQILPDFPHRPGNVHTDAVCFRGA